ncbi:MAG TPA: response regulator transcription factor [Prolixibacteraceae bacterium]|nr:response regulator transcription factor [Prolixibacteraceae bacterium]
MISLGLFDEHRLSLEGLGKLVEEADELEIGFLCDNRNQLRAKMKLHPVNVLLLTLHDLTVKGINLIVKLGIEYPRTKIMVISTHESEEIILQTIKAGAKGYIGPEAGFKELVQAIYTLRCGHDYFSDSITHLLLNRYIKNLKEDETGTPSGLSSLSTRQVEIVKLWGNSFSNQEIADKLCISVRTVESHKNHIMQKLNLKSTVDLVKFGIKNNIIDI